MKNIALKILLAVSGLVTILAGCNAASTKAASTSQPVEVKRGDLEITVTTDGNLSMPNAYNLSFGTQGQVTSVLVNEGDYVRQGALLATQDPSSQIDAIKNALFSIQTAQNNISFACGSDHLPYNYPDLSISRMADEAQKDIYTAYSYYLQGKYKDAGYWLMMTYFDTEVCQNLIQTRPNAAELAGTKSNSTYYPDPNAGNSVPLSQMYQDVVDYLGQYQLRLLAVSSDMKVGAYDKVGQEFEAVTQESLTVTEKAKSTITIHSRMIYQYADTQSSADFLQSSLRSVQDLQSYMISDNASPVEAAKQLYTATLSLQVARDVLQTQTLIFETGGMNWQQLQQYNLALQKAEISLYQAKQNIMQTMIMAPSDGYIVAVNAMVSSVTSAQNYSSTTAIQLVDTSYVRFTGQVDEIDIMKVTPGENATITVDAIPNKTFTGHVKFISPFGATVGQVIKFTVYIELDPTNVTLKGGLSATAVIEAANVKNVLLIPVSVITNTNRGPIVMVINEKTGASERRSLTLGLQNFQYAEVKSGLQEGDKITAVSQQFMGTGGTSPTGGGGGAFRALR